MGLAPVSSEPLVERVLRNRPLLSGYWSLVAHLGIGLLLALIASDGRPAASRPRLLVIDPRPMAIDADGTAIGAFVHQPAPPADVSTEPSMALPAEPTATGGLQASDPPPARSRTAAVADPNPGASPEVDSMSQAEVERDSEPAAEPADSTSGVRGRRPFAGRSGPVRGDLVRSRGGSPQSEAAVEAGLAWLAAHQAVDGSWRCDLTGCGCDGACRDSGSIASTTASTAIALLPFLGAGSTHEDGPYREAVSRGIYYLASRLKPTPRGGDFCEGTMYGQGLATLALAEAYGMTGDDLLRNLVIDAIRFIETSQDQYTGGWRYLPGQPGDITVTAWQVAALKSGELAGLVVPSPTFGGAVRFLDRVQSMRGAAYGYRSPSAKLSTSAIGLLCRMYTGWKPGDEPLDRGIARLVAKTPNPREVYANFYLSQLLLQAGHPAWPAWNARLRDGLVRMQSKVGHESGSWFLDDPETAAGGRLAHTALAILTLEVYYRLLPIYGEEAVAGSF